jgi:hypothetical protein
MSLENKKSRQQRVQRYGKHFGGDYFIRAVKERKGKALRGLLLLRVYTSSC